MWQGQLKNITVDFVLASPAVSHMPSLSYLDGFSDRRYVSVELLFGGFQDLFNIYIYIYIYIVIHRQICFVLSEHFSVVRQARFPKLGSKPGWLKRQSNILPLSHEETSAREGNLNGYESQLLLFTYIRLTATESSIHMKSLALRLWQQIYFIR